MPNTPIRFAVCSCLMLLCGPWSNALAEDTLFDPFTGMRIAQYRAPIPAPPDGIAAVTTDELPALIDTGALLVDVNPLRSFQIAEDGTWNYPERHETLAGAIWLPVVGWGVIEPWAEDYLRISLAQNTEPDDPVVIFCLLDCWLSWNAVQRVRALGHNAYWYPGGVDDWQAAGRGLVPVEPLPFRE